MRRLIITTLCTLLVSGFAVGLVRSQSASGSLAGTVLTEKGDPAQDAVVQARRDATGTLRTAVSDKRGRYRMEGLAPGRWIVVARLGDGSLSETRTVTLHLQQTTTLDFSVSAGKIEKVTVTAEQPMVDRKQTAGHLRISGDDAIDLPIDQGTITNLALLDSSVRQAAPGTFYGERSAVFTVNGQSGRSNSFLVDGLDNNDPISGTTPSLFVSELGLQEFVLMTNQYAAEFGRATGGVLNAVSRRGSNESTLMAIVQGTVDNWNSTGDFTSSLPNSDVSQSAVERFHAGVGFGGAFKKDRAYYWALFEHRSADNLIGYTGVDGDGNPGGRLVAPTETNTFTLRTDFNLGTSNTLMIRLQGSRSNSEGVLVEGVFTPESGFEIGDETLRLGASLMTVISPALLSETRFLASTYGFDQRANSVRPAVTRPSGVFGGNVLNRQMRDTDVMQLAQNLTYRKGSHTMKFGVDLIRSKTRIEAGFNPSGSFLYEYDMPFNSGGCGDILVTQVSSAAPDGSVNCLFDDTAEPGNIYSYPLYYTLVDGEPQLTLDDTSIVVFAQDSAEVARKWVLNYGLRYDLATYELPSDAAVPSTIPNGGATRDTDNVAPRLAFTFTPRVGGNLLIRGGAGVFYDKLALAFPAAAGIVSGTKIGFLPVQGFAFELTEDNLASSQVPLVFPEPLTLRFSTGTELETPYTVQYNLGLEKGIGPNQSFRVDLVQTQGYHLPLIKDLNPVSGLVPSTLGLPLLTGDLTACPVGQIDPTLDVGVPCHARDPERGSIAAIVTEGRSWYRGLNLNYHLRRERSWFHASYTLSKAEDQGFDPLKGGISLPPDSDDIEGERGRADGDRLHRLVLSGDLPLPGGIRASMVADYSTGIPYNVTTGQDGNLDGIPNDRPPGVGRNSGEDTPLEAINAARDQPVVALDPIDSVPDEPDFFQVNLRLYKNFPMGGKLNGDFFLQIFNVFDRENVGLVEGRVLSPNFGKALTLAGPPRTIELGMRVAY